ncbi:MAG: four helix bundle protein [Caldilineaceae bacterium]
MKESPLFTKTHDLLRWLLSATRKFPRDQRFVLAQRIHQQSFAFQDAIVAASLDQREQPRHLLRADILLTGLRKTLLLCFEMDFLDKGQYFHVSAMVKEVGNLLGAWRQK